MFDLAYLCHVDVTRVDDLKVAHFIILIRGIDKAREANRG